jgi:hypothetical protein
VLSGAIGSAQLVAAVGAWFFSLITGRAPRGLRDLAAFGVKYDGQHLAYVLLLTDRYPYSGPTLHSGPAHRTWLPPLPPEQREWMSSPEAVTG